MRRNSVHCYLDENILGVLHEEPMQLYNQTFYFHHRWFLICWKVFKCFVWVDKRRRRSVETHTIWKLKLLFSVLDVCFPRSVCISVFLSAPSFSFSFLFFAPFSLTDPRLGSRRLCNQISSLCVIRLEAPDGWTVKSKTVYTTTSQFGSCQ